MELHPLGKLIDEVQRRNGWSLRALQKRGEDLGLHRVSHANLGRLKGEPLVSVKGSNIKELSAVLGVPESVVARAALASMGVTLPREAATPEEAVWADVTLSERDKRVVLAALRTMREG